MDIHEKVKLWEREEGAALFEGLGLNFYKKVDKNRVHSILYSVYIIFRKLY